MTDQRDAQPAAIGQQRPGGRLAAARPSLRTATAGGDPRVSRLGLSPTVGCGVSLLAGAPSFAAAIHERYRQWTGEPATSSPVLRRSRAVVMLQPLHRQTILQVAPRLALTLVCRVVAEAAPASANGPDGRASLGAVASASDPVGTLVLAPRLVERSAEVLVERVTRRAVRIEVPRRLDDLVVRAGPGSAPTGTLAVPGLPPSGPLPRVVQRPSRPLPPAEPAPAAWPSTARPTPPGDMTWGHDEPAVSAAVVPPALDVDRLTEQVIRTLDRRLVAQRERMGWS